MKSTIDFSLVWAIFAGLVGILAIGHLFYRAATAPTSVELERQKRAVGKR